MEIRDATIKDLAIISRLNQNLFKHDSEFDRYLVLDWPMGKEGQDYFSKRITDDDKICLLVEDDTLVVGYLAGSLVIDSTREGLVASLDNMLVEERYRKQGCGTALYSAFKGWAELRGVNRISVSAYSNNSEALSFYRSIGFLPLAETLEVDL